MKIQHSGNRPVLPQRCLASQPLVGTGQPDQVAVGTPPDFSGPVPSRLPRGLLVGGAAALGGGALAAAAGLSWGQSLGLMVPMAVLGWMGAALWGSAEPDVPLTPQLDKLLEGRFHDDQKQGIQKALNALGAANVDKLVAGGVKIAVDPERVPDKAAACYYPAERKVIFRRCEVTREIAVHELGHALDSLDLPPDQVGRAYYRSQVDAELLSNYETYIQRLESGQQPRRQVRWSDYAQTNEKEYLAEGVTWFLASPEKQAELKQKDRRHYDYVEKFLNPGN